MATSDVLPLDGSSHKRNIQSIWRIPVRHFRTQVSLKRPSVVPVLDTSCPRLYGPTVYVSGHRVYSVKRKKMVKKRSFTIS